MDKHARILVAGTQTVTGGAILRQLKQQGYTTVTGEPGKEPDLTDAAQVDTYFSEISPDRVFLAAGKSGGISANQKYPASLMLDNLAVASNVIGSAHRHGVKKLLYLASSCCYPRECVQPMRVDSLLSGPLEPTNAAYATAKLAGIKLCEAYRQQYGANFVAVIPANEFGPGDDFGLEDSHVIAALIRKMNEANITGAENVAIWGTGTAKRDFIFADDLAEACIVVMREYQGPEPINIGSGTGLTIKEISELIKDVVGYQGDLTFDTSKPDGMPTKVLDSSDVMALGWRPRTDMRDALAMTYDWWSGMEHSKFSDDGAPIEAQGIPDRSARG